MNDQHTLATGPVTDPVADPVTDLWRAYKASDDLELRNRLVLQYSPLVKYVAGRVRAGLPPNIDQADLVSEGVIGLMDAIEKFEPERGLQFQTYAVPRIRGAIIDGVRATDWVPRSVRSRTRDLEQARTRLEHRLSRTPTEEELAADLSLTVSELRAAAARPSYIGHVSADELEEMSELADLAPGFAEALEDEETRRMLMSAVHELPERDRIIIALYFFEGLTLGEIGLVLGVTESRVSQLRSRATRALRQRLQLDEAV